MSLLPAPAKDAARNKGNTQKCVLAVGPGEVGQASEILPAAACRTSAESGALVREFCSVRLQRRQRGQRGPQPSRLLTEGLRRNWLILFPR